MAEASVVLCGHTVPLHVSTDLHLSPDIVARVLHSQPFLDWQAATNAQQEYRVQQVELRQVDLLGPHISGLKLRVWTRKQDAGGADLDGATEHNFLLRGALTGLLLVLTCGAEGSFVVLASQPRLAVASLDLLEVPLGLIDADGWFAGVTAQEVAEELHLRLHRRDLRDLTALAFSEGAPGLLLSAGHSDEHIHLYSHEVAVSAQQLAKFRERVAVPEGDLIDLHLVPLRDVWQRTADCKTLAAVHLFQTLQPTPARQGN